MRKFYITFLSILMALGAFAQTPNDFVVYGVVTQAGTTLPVFGQPVYIYQILTNPDSSVLVGVDYTDSNGEYLYTVINGSQTGPNQTYAIVSYGCNGQQVYQEVANQQGTLDNYSYDFTICPDPTQQCSAQFTTTISGFGVYILTALTNQVGTYQWQVNGEFYTGNPLTVSLPVGAYQACLTFFNNEGCQSFYCDSILVGQQQGLSITGNVFYGDSLNCPACVNDALVILYKEETTQNNSIVVLYDTAPVQNGYYQFNNLEAGNYFVYGMIDPLSANYGAYMPTFSIDEAMWGNASPTILSNANAQANVHLIPVNNPNGGPGQIGGGVNMDDTLRAGTGGSAVVFLETLTGDVIAYDIADDQGQFLLTNLPMGTYNIGATLAGYGSFYQNITLEPMNPIIGDIQIDLPTLVISVNTTVAAIENLYPNPTQGNSQLVVSSKQKCEATITVTNLLGQQVYASPVSLVSGENTIELKLSNLSNGIYTVTLTSQANSLPQIYKLAKQ